MCPPTKAVGLEKEIDSGHLSLWQRCSQHLLPQQEKDNGALSLTFLNTVIPRLKGTFLI